jgi:hypothetical protein
VDAPGPVERAPATPVVVPTRVLVEGLTALAGAGGRLEVAEVVLPLLLDLPGVRAAAVVERAGADVVVQGSAGYACDAMGPGTRLPLDAGLPVTEAVRTPPDRGERTRAAWVGVALPSARGGSTPAEPARRSAAGPGSPRRLAQAVGSALERVGRTEVALAELAALTAGTTPAVDLDPALDVVVRSVPLEGDVGGDVLLSCRRPATAAGWSWPTSAAAVSGRRCWRARSRRRPGRWRRTRPGRRSCSGDLERSLRPVVGQGSFVTRSSSTWPPGGASVASAGHPPPLLLTAGGASALDVPPGQPLALETGRTEAYVAVAVDLPPDALLVLHTDGLGDREGARGTDPLDLLRDVPLGDPATVADAVLAAADRAGAATDDVALMVVRPGPVGAFPGGLAG